MLIGEYESRLGDKNRIFVPKVLRKELGENLIITRGYDQCLILVDKKRWKTLIQSIEVKPILSVSVRDLKRFLIGGALEVVLDKQGRFVLNAMLIDFAHLKKEIIFVGIKNWVEIWSKDKWIQRMDYLSKNIEDIAERLIK